MVFYQFFQVTPTCFAFDRKRFQPVTRLKQTFALLSILFLELSVCFFFFAQKKGQQHLCCCPVTSGILMILVLLCGQRLLICRPAAYTRLLYALLRGLHPACIPACPALTRIRTLGNSGRLLSLLL